MYLASLPATIRPSERTVRFRGSAILLCTLLLFTGCSTPLSRQRASRSFTFGRDTFAFSNGLVWHYDFDPVSGRTTHSRESPRPDYTHHCFVVSRTARQFYCNARFDPTVAKAGEEDYRHLVRNVVASSLRRPRSPANQIVIPGYSNLFEFSRDYEQLLKDQCGGAWHSYCQRGHLRMIFPFTRSHQKKMAAQLVSRLQSGDAPVVHIVRFPKLSINHAMVLFDFKETSEAIEFSAYDPNNAGEPMPVTFLRTERWFSMPRTKYFTGGRVDLYEIYHSWLN
jgi:hypothetical protein